MITLSGNDPQTTLPAPTTQFLPKVVPFKIIELAPIFICHHIERPIWLVVKAPPDYSTDDY